MNVNITHKPCVATSRRMQIGAFFKQHRLSAGVSIESIVQDLDLASAELLLAYESGQEAIPLDDIFSLTNLLNIPPEDVLALLYDVHSQDAL